MRDATCLGQKAPVAVEKCLSVKQSTSTGWAILDSFCFHSRFNRIWEEAYWNLTFYDYESIVSKTGCRRPCTYYQYKFIGDTFCCKV